MVPLCPPWDPNHPLSSIFTSLTLLVTSVTVLVMITPVILVFVYGTGYYAELQAAARDVSLPRWCE